jgi:hypothetical protein
MKRLVIWLGLAGVLAVVVALGGQDARGSSSTHDTVLRFKIETRPHNRAILWRNGQRAGVLLQATRTVDRKGGALGFDAVVLREGQVFLAAGWTSRHDDRPDVAVIGGTGAYASARGTGVVDYSGTTNYVEVSFRTD